jgi:prepilin signal peptidase PulO-like enzyme (type II secretory pathway)
LSKTLVKWWFWEIGNILDKNCWHFSESTFQNFQFFSTAFVSIFVLLNWSSLHRSLTNNFFILLALFCALIYFLFGLCVNFLDQREAFQSAYRK